MKNIPLLIIMGQLFRVMSYDREANERNAIPGLKFLGHPLKWHRLDDGVMGGRSETHHSVEESSQSGSSILHFSGQINTTGGGFCSIRARIAGGMPSNTIALRIKHIGDGKTYKLLLSDCTKSTFGPSRRSPSWQADIPTSKTGVEEISEISLDSLTPSMIGGPITTDSKLDPTQVQEMGFMLSLKLSNGQPNPVDTFGTGVFDFSLRILSIEPVGADGKSLSNFDSENAEDLK